MRDPDRTLGFALVAFIMAAALAAFLVGLWSGRTQSALYRITMDLARNAVVALGEAQTVAGVRPEHMLYQARSGAAGVTVNDPAGDQSDMILLSGFFGDSNELRLVRRDGTVVARWPVAFSELFPDPSYHYDPPKTDWNIELHGALAMPDGSVVFNFEYGGLVRLDRCGGVMWTLRRVTHHSVERAPGGGFWVPERRRVNESPDDAPEPFPPFEPPYAEDFLLRVSDDGRVLREISAVGILYRDGLQPLMTINKSAPGGSWDDEIVHLNEIKPLRPALAADFPSLDAGDLALSFRTLNTVVVVDGQDFSVKWRGTGPWLRQHDPEFVEGGRLALFNNNVFPSPSDSRSDETSAKARRHSEIMLTDLHSPPRVIYGDDPDEPLRTTIRGKIDPTPLGYLITEPEGGRALEVDRTGRKVWEYVNRWDADYVAMITEARRYPADYFEVDDWSCPAGSGG